ncbi:MAG TPA: pyridoxamine 5'-phosphate oxidase family protein [Candidatus Binatia bacterium]|nr:pyridoxamine 5'-phosphate oxidase family protein [Candidatus Binatia bacterium]
MDDLGFRELARARCLELLATVPVGRVGLSVGALPVVLPVNFVLAGDRLVFRTVPGTKLDAAAVRAVVAFEADAYDAGGAWGWSVMVQGQSAEITAPEELAEMRKLRLDAWAQPQRATRFVAVRITFVSGRCFGELPAMLAAAAAAPQANRR